MGALTYSLDLSTRYFWRTVGRPSTSQANTAGSIHHIPPEVWSQWNALFAPGGELFARVWGRRVEQLALPVQPLSVSRGMSSVVRVVHDVETGDAGTRAGAAWLRNLRSDGSRVYSGYYRVGRLPGNRQPRVYVSFPLESDSIQVYLAPRDDPDGSF
ncbi:MAG: hypothetical protein QOI01_1312 [Mycobacterium sp.]|jgi:hypothetical protein|nr:hypothetical protein [Mycobacterium sp.]